MMPLAAVGGERLLHKNYSNGVSCWTDIEGIRTDTEEIRMKIRTTQVMVAVASSCGTDR